VEGSPTNSERRRLAEFCALLPKLRELAEQGMWSDELEHEVGELDSGGSATEAFRRLYLFTADPEALRGQQPPPGIEGAHLAGLADVTLDGNYRCPAARCDRRGRRDDRGRVPACTINGKPMVFRAEA